MVWFGLVRFGLRLLGCFLSCFFSAKLLYMGVIILDNVYEIELAGHDVS